MPLNFSCVLFDLDGTLLNSNHLIIESFKYTLKTILNIEISEEELFQYFGEPLAVTLARFDANKVEEMLTTYRRFNTEKHDKLTTVFPGIPEVIKELHKHKIKMGIVTSKLRGSAQKGIKLAGISDYIEVLVAYEDTNYHKPEAAPILKALQQLNHSTQKTVMVGDSPFDWSSAKNAGVSSVGVKWSVHLPTTSKEEYPDFTIGDFADLIDLCTK